MNGDRYRAGKRLWSEADDARLRCDYPDTPTETLARELRRTLASTYNRAKLLGLTKSEAYLASPAACRLRRGDHVGVAYQFKPGQAPLNKGLRRPGWGPGRMKATQFKPGLRIWHQRNVGDTRVVDGYIYRKIAETPRVPWTRNWKLDHWLVWEAAHGPVPAGHNVAFKNGDRTDIRLDNLECISRRAQMARNTVHNLPQPLKHTIQVLGQLTRRIREKEKGHGSEKQDHRSA